MAKKLPEGTWLDTVHNAKFVVLRYDSRSRVYRVRYLTAGLRGCVLSAPVEEFGPGLRYQPPTLWDHIAAALV